MSEAINQLPKDWKWVKLGEVCDIISGKNHPHTFIGDEIGKSWTISVKKDCKPFIS